MVPLVLSPMRHAALTAGLEASVPATAGSQHFTLYCLDPAEHTGASEPEVVVVHSFSPARIDNNLGYYVANELLPLLTAAWGRAPYGPRADSPFAYDEQAVFEHCVGAIVRSMDGNERRAWHRFYDNSLAALERAMAEPSAPPDFIGPFGAIYRRLMALVRGRTLLDAGTCFGFLPLLLARLLARQGQAGPGGERRLPDGALDQIVGCDLEGALIDFATAYAAQQRCEGVRFARADMLADDFARLGAFDTVTAIHVLEHLEPGQTSAALANLWRVTARRLIVAVPLEQRPDPRFGHRQVFTEASLLALGSELGGRCRTFTLHGVWLIVDKDAL